MSQPLIERLVPEDKDELFACCERVLNSGKRYGSKKKFLHLLNASFDPDHSIKISLCNRIIGGYILNANNTLYKEFNLTAKKIDKIKSLAGNRATKSANRLRHFVNIIQSYEGPGIQGYALFLERSFRQRGWGRLLIEYPYTLFPQFKYIWGGQEKDLCNMYDWLKRRELFFEDDASFYTICPLDPDKRIDG